VPLKMNTLPVASGAMQNVGVVQDTDTSSLFVGQACGHLNLLGE